MADRTDPLSRKIKTRQEIGRVVEYHLCLDCYERIDDLALPYVDRAAAKVLEGDDAGVPFECHKCGGELKPRG